MSKYSKSFTHDFNECVIKKLRDAKDSIPLGATPNDIIMGENVGGWIDQMVDEIKSRGLQVEGWE